MATAADWTNANRRDVAAEEGLGSNFIEPKETTLSAIVRRASMRQLANKGTCLAREGLRCAGRFGARPLLHLQDFSAICLLENEGVENARRLC